jgi:hypothetical protein
MAVEPSILPPIISAAAGLIGVILGALLNVTWMVWSDWRARGRNARYLAIRAVCILDKYIEDCAEVVTDDGLCEGMRNKEGCLEAQVSSPPPPAFPEDLDWKSVEHALMYRLLSLPSEAEAADRKIRNASRFSYPPDYDEFFEERQDQYAKLGLAAFALTQEIRKKYSIQPQELGEWNPTEYLTEAKERIEKERQNRGQRLAELPSLLADQ